MKTFYVALCRWPNGSYGLPVSTDRYELQGMGALRLWAVRATAKNYVVPMVVAHLAGEAADVHIVSAGGASRP